MTPEEKAKKQYSALVARFAQASKMLEAIELLTPENFAMWIDHLTDLAGSIDERLGRVEKRIDDAGIAPLADGIPDDQVPAYLALYSVNPLAEFPDSYEVMRQRLAAYRDAQPAGEEISS